MFDTTLIPTKTNVNKVILENKSSKNRASDITLKTPQSLIGKDMSIYFEYCL